MSARLTTARVAHKAPSNVEASAFQTTYERCCLSPADQDAAPALIINPAASVTVLLAAIEARVTRISMHLGAWENSSGDDQTTPAEIVSPSMDLAEEIELLLMEIQARRRAEGGAS